MTSLAVNVSSISADHISDDLVKLGEGHTGFKIVYL